MTEIGYFEELGRRHRDSVRIEFGKTGGAPGTLVGNACRDIDKNRHAQRRGDPLYDEIWCVFDRDTHPNFNQAISRALQKGVETAVSNPCFELWPVLHRQDQTAHIGRHEVQRLARELGLIEGKVIRAEVFDDLMDAHEDAKKRAKQLDRMHEGNGSPPRSNPALVCGGWWIRSVRIPPAGHRIQWSTQRVHFPPTGHRLSPHEKRLQGALWDAAPKSSGQSAMKYGTGMGKR